MGDGSQKTQASKTGDYDPHDYRNVKNPTNNWQTMAHLLKGSIGTGVLAMPSAFAHAGYINGVIMTVIIGIITVYCLHVLIGSMYILSQRKQVPYLTYAQAMMVGFQQGPPIFGCIVPIVTPFIDGFLAFYQFGICCVYVVFISASNKQVIDEYFTVISLRLHICIVLVPLLLVFSITSLRALAFFTSFAVMLTFVGFGVVAYYVFTDLPPLSEREKVEDVLKWPIMFGTVLFSIEALGVFLAIEENMKTPKDYLRPLGIMNVGMIIILSLYISVGFFGYWKYGDETKGSITLNIPQEEVLSQITKIIFAFVILITYSLQGYVTNDIIWHKYLMKRVEDTSKHFRYEMCIRYSLVFASFLFALLVPSVGLFLSLVGSFCLSLLGIAFPALLQICIQYNSGYGPFKIRLIINILLIIFGIFGGIIGSYTSIVTIVETLY